jgi:hypothetical protein
MTLVDDVAAEFRAVLVAADGHECIVDARVEFPDGARAMLLAANWHGQRGVLDAIVDVGIRCLARVGAERLLALAGGERVSIRASVDDVRDALVVIAPV